MIQKSIIGLTMTIYMAGLCVHAEDKKEDGALAPYICHRASGDITIDGKLDDGAWAKAEAITVFYRYENGQPCDLAPANVRILWGDQFLYVAFNMTDDDVWSFSSIPDDELWQGDVAEIFIKPNTADTRYFEFISAPNGTLFDSAFPSRGAGAFKRFRSWSSGAKVAAQVHGTDGDPSDTDQGYIVEMAIPLTVFPEGQRAPEANDWTFGVFRYDYSKSFDDPLMLMSIPKAEGHGFHSYEGYRPLRFED